jgi:hypothetical protein
MHHPTKIAAPRALLKEAARRAVSHAFPAWIDDSESGIAQPSVMPRVRDGLILRLVAGRRRERSKNLFHAAGAS